MSVMINARGTNTSSFRIGVSGPVISEQGVITPTEATNITINTPVGRALVVNSGLSEGQITTDTTTLNINAPRIRLGGITWPTVDGVPGQVLQTNGAGVLYWGTPGTGSGTPTFDTQPANTAFMAPSGSNGTPTFRKILAQDIPILNQNTTGNAGTATRLVAGRTISATGDGAWSVVFDGASSVTSGFTLTPTGVAPGTYTQVVVDAKGRVTAGSRPTTIAGYGITDAVTLNTPQTFTAAKVFNDSTFFGGITPGQAGNASVIASASGTNPALAVVTRDSAGGLGTLSMYGTLPSGDAVPKRVADMWAGFNGGSWGTEYIAWGVGKSTGGDNNNGVRTDERMRLTNAGLLCSGDIAITSDERVKTDWQDLPDNTLARIAEILSGSYTRVDTGVRQVGVSAQQLREIMPDAVREASDGMLSVAYGNAAMVICVALARRIIELEERLNGITDQR